MNSIRNHDDRVKKRQHLATTRLRTRTFIILNAITRSCVLNAYNALVNATHADWCGWYQYEKVVEDFFNLSCCVVHFARVLYWWTRVVWSFRFEENKRWAKLVFASNWSYTDSTSAYITSPRPVAGIRFTMSVCLFHVFWTSNFCYSIFTFIHFFCCTHFYSRSFLGIARMKKWTGTNLDQSLVSYFNDIYGSTPHPRQWHRREYSKASLHIPESICPMPAEISFSMHIHLTRIYSFYVFTDYVTVHA